MEGGAEHLRRRGREHDHQHLRSDRHDRGVGQGAPENGIGENRAVIGEPGPPEAETAGGGGAEAEDDREHEGHADEQQHVGERRRQQGNAQDVLTVGEAAFHRRCRAPVAASK